MFTGIIASRCIVKNAVHTLNSLQLVICLHGSLCEGLQQGASVAINGVCLTVTLIENDELVHFHVMGETLRCTNFSKLRISDSVNVERALRACDELGGHHVSGHVDCKGTIDAIERIEENVKMWFTIERPELSRFLLPKGWIAVSGVSLTVVDVDVSTSRFSVCLIPETLKVTTLGLNAVGDEINLEFDGQTKAIVTTTERILENSPHIQQLIKDAAIAGIIAK